MYKTLFCRLQFVCVLNLLELLLLTFFNGDNIFFSKLVKAQDINSAWSVCAFLYIRTCIHLMLRFYKVYSVNGKLDDFSE